MKECMEKGNEKITEGYSMPDSMREVIEKHFSVDERMMMAYEPVLLDLVGGVLLMQAVDVARSQRLPLCKECRRIRELADNLKRMLFDKLEYNLQQLLSNTVTSAMDALRLSTNLIYDLNSKIKNVNYKLADFLTYTYSATLLLQMATRVEWYWADKVKGRCRMGTEMPYDVYRSAALMYLAEIHNREMKGARLDLDCHQNVVRNLIEKFIIEMKEEVK